jgi:hypothetical protein
MVTVELLDVFEPGSLREVLERALVDSEAKGNAVSSKLIRERLAALP